MNFMSSRLGFHEDTGIGGLPSLHPFYRDGGGGAEAQHLDSSPTIKGKEDSGNDHNTQGGGVMERVHMFDKTVTPSDVGKLNRLVIPKQHAEKYFPLDSSTSDKGLLLNFEDRNGKQWRFRYSYWNSSQSYVMTKGWSRFVKDKKLDPGDVVSFHRGVGALAKDRLFIDCTRRLDAPTLFQIPNPYPFFHRSYFWHPYPQNDAVLNRNPSGSTRFGGNGQIAIQGKAVAKRLRLFGVNMDCPISDSDHSPSPPSDLHLNLPYSNHHHKGKGSISDLH